MSLAETFPAGSPSEARAFGETFYFTGVPCKRGHVSARYASTAQCVQCIADRPRATPQASRAASKRYYAANRDAELERMRERRLTQPEYAGEWRAANPGRTAFYTAAYKAAKRQATPAWLTQDQKNEIAALYAEAARLTKETGVPHEVDHTIPINGEGVCGLHVPWNMTVMTQEANRKKGRAF